MLSSPNDTETEATNSSVCQCYLAATSDPAATRGRSKRVYKQRAEANGRKSMTSFDNREKAFEDRFAQDAYLKFKAEARRNKMLGAWAAEKLGLTGDEAEAYVNAVRKADLAEAGDDDVFRKVRDDFTARSVAISDAELRGKIDGYLVEAVKQLESGV